jgi:hypothetical protein
MRASSRANSVAKRRSRINSSSAVNGGLATGQHAIDHAAAVVPLAANGPVEKVVTVTKSGFCILINGDDDGLDVLVAPTLQGRVTPGLR